MVDARLEQRPAQSTAVTATVLRVLARKHVVFGVGHEAEHEARAVAFEEALLTHPGDAGFLVWGDPAFYDSTIRVVDRVLARGRVEAVVDVVPGISSIQLLAARHRVVLHEVGQPLHVTTGRRLREAVEAGQDNLVVMLNRTIDLTRVEAARERAKGSAGWVMDVFLLRRPSAYDGVGA